MCIGARWPKASRRNQRVYVMRRRGIIIVYICTAEHRFCSLLIHGLAETMDDSCFFNCSTRIIDHCGWTFSVYSLLIRTFTGIVQRE